MPGFTAHWASSLEGFKSHHALRESCSEKEEVEVAPASCWGLGIARPAQRGWRRRSSQHWRGYTQRKWEAHFAGVCHVLYIAT